MATNYREIWEIATPLNEAWLRWARSDIRAAHEDNSVPDIFAEDSDESVGMRVLQVIETLATAWTKPQRKESLERTMQNDLVGWLIEKEYYAYGFPVFPKPLRVPRLIICDFWINAVINWKKEIAEDANLKFQRIRIVDPGEYPEFDFKPKVGRKSQKPLIHRAITEILKTNQKFQSKTHKEKAAKIRNYIRIHKPDLDPLGQGLKDGAIRKHVNSYFQEKSKE